jgi:hypothetical protein
MRGFADEHGAWIARLRVGRNIKIKKYEILALHWQSKNQHIDIIDLKFLTSPKNRPAEPKNHEVGLILILIKSHRVQKY